MHLLMVHTKSQCVFWCRSSLAGDLAWADHPGTSLLDWSDSSSEASQRIGGPRIILDSRAPLTNPAAASPPGSLSPASSLRSSPDRPQPLPSSQARLPAFARMYDSPAFLPDRRRQLASGRPDDAGNMDEASENEQWKPRRSDSMNLSQLQGGLSSMLGLSASPSQSRLPGPTSQLMSNLLSAPAMEPQMEPHVPISGAASNLRLFHSPAYALSADGTSQASSSAQSSPEGPSVSSAPSQRESSYRGRLGMQMVSNGLFMS